MNLMIKSLVDRYVENINHRALLSGKELRSLTLRGISRKEIRRNLFLSQARRIAGLPPQSGLPASAAKALLPASEETFLGQVAPFVLPELAHGGAAFAVQRDAVAEIAALEMSDDDLERVVETLAARPAIYVDFPAGTVCMTNAWDVRAVFVTNLQGWLTWSAVSVSNMHGGAVGISHWKTRFDGTEHNLIGIPVEKWNCDPETQKVFCKTMVGLVYRCLATAGYPQTTVVSRLSKGEGPSPKIATKRQDTVEILGRGDFQFRVKPVTATGPRLETGSRGTGQKRDRHIIVQGHWRHVACGKGRQQRRWKWIEPFHQGLRDRPLETRSSLTIVRTFKARPDEDTRAAATGSSS